MVSQKDGAAPDGGCKMPRASRDPRAACPPAAWQVVVCARSWCVRTAADGRGTRESRHEVGVCVWGERRAGLCLHQKKLSCNNAVVGTARRRPPGTNQARPRDSATGGLSWRQLCGFRPCARVWLAFPSIGRSIRQQKIVELGGVVFEWDLRCPSAPPFDYSVCDADSSEAHPKILRGARRRVSRGREGGRHHAMASSEGGWTHPSLQDIQCPIRGPPRAPSACPFTDK